MNIYWLNTHPSAAGALAYAAEELQRCLQIMTGAPVNRAAGQQYQPGTDGLWLGLFADFGLRPASDHPLDDEIHLAVENGHGLIAGANPRSALMAVYRYLAALGCRWVRPGAEGEFIPPAEAAASVHLHEAPSYRHRTVCIEGAVSLENVLEMVDWLPKVGLAGYFMQFREGFTFFDRWYSHRSNPLKTPQAFSVEQARQFTQQIEAELQKRGLVYHAIGHGWTCEAYGLPCLGWDMESGRAWPPEFLHDVAEVNGKRSVPWDIVSIAALCYSDPQVQARLANCVADYAAAHPQIDLLHVWLDDGFNNKCECARCRDHRPADDYIAILNQIDAGLAQRGLPHKVVFLAYVDMLWPPERERLANPARFFFMFAPISRTYRQVMRRPAELPAELPALPPFERNHLQFPSDIPSLLAFLQGWQAAFQGDSFDFDYHFIFNGLYQLDPGLLKLARVVYEDVRELRKLGLNGMVSCQLQRVFFPTGLGMYSMARTLWDETLDFDFLAQDYFASAFGKDGGRAQAYLGRLGEALDLGWLKQMGPADEVSAGCRAALQIIRRFLPVIRRNLQAPHACHARSWQYLYVHAQTTRRLAKILLAKAQGRPQQAGRDWAALKQFVCEHEDEVQPVLDVWGFVEAYEKLVNDQPAR